ncbi:MAG: acetyl-CoA C-acetyltransferase [Gammaproteobacteria bacterium]|nr:acetyl-CoA C-acetyltransferase [Gammaproteobacteria bacterium]
MREAWIIDHARSPRGRGKPGVGSLSHLHPQRCLAQVLNGLQERVGFDPADIEDVVAGCGAGSGDHAHDIARMSVLDAGWPLSVTGVTLHRFCGSGQQAVSFAAMGVMSGQQEAVIGGGVEFMSRYAPVHANGFHANNEHLRQRHPQVPQGISADLISTLEGFSRDDVDAYAVESQTRAAHSIEEGRFKPSLVPIHNEDGSLALDRDEHPRPGTTLESLKDLKPSFAAMADAQFDGFDRPFKDMVREVYPDVAEIDHMHHAGNSSGVVDGASAVLVTSPDYAKAHGLKPKARIRMTATAGTEPLIMLTAPAPAAQRCLDKAGMTTGDIDLFEINEAFASVVLKFMKEMEVDHDVVNVDGGAIALGHPIGATGGMLIGTAVEQLHRLDKETALVAMCTGGGMGTATILERV